MNRFLLFMVALIILSMAVNAQRARQKGFVVVDSGDTLYGWLNCKGGLRNPGQISFYADSVSKQATHYTVADLRSFEIYGSDAFARATVGKDVPMSEILPNTASLSDTMVKQTVFLRVLLIGSKISLYEWMEEKEHYYIRENAGEYQELKLKTMNDGSPDIPLYKNLLTALSIKYNEQQELAAVIENARYDEDVFKNIVIKLNGEHNIIRTRSKSYHTHLAWFAGGGVSIASMKISGNKTYIGNLDFKGSVAPYFSGGVELSGFGVDRLALRLELAYTSATYDGEGESITSSNNKITYGLQQKNIAAVLSAQYSLIQRKMFVLNAGLGASCNFSSYSDNSWHQSFPEVTIHNYAMLKKNWVAGNMKLGAVIAKKWEVSLARPFFDDFMFKSTNYSFDHSTFHWWIGYHFK